MVKVSVIVPIYNIEDYLRECVDSLCNQTLKDIQIILVDDGSTDSCGEIIDQYASEDNRIVAIHKKNGGQSSARNLGFKKATGEYVLYVDGDDYLVLDAIEKLYEEAKRCNADIIQGDLLNDAQRLQDPSYRYIPCENTLTPSLEYVYEVVKNEIYDIVPFLYMVKRDYLKMKQMQFAEGYFYEDQLYTMQLLSHCDGKILKIRFPYYFYRMDRPGSTTNHMTLKKGLDAAYICKEMYAYIQKNISDNDKKVFDAILLISLYQYYRVYLRIKRYDRKRVWKSVEFVNIFASLETEYYEQLKKELQQFIQNRKFVELKWDIKTGVRKLLRRN